MLSYLQNGNSYSDKMASLYWMRPLIYVVGNIHQNWWTVHSPHKGPVMQKELPFSHPTEIMFVHSVAYIQWHTIAVMEPCLAPFPAGNEVISQEEASLCQSDCPVCTWLCCVLFWIIIISDFKGLCHPNCCHFTNTEAVINSPQYQSINLEVYMPSWLIHPIVSQHCGYWWPCSLVPGHQ